MSVFIENQLFSENKTNFTTAADFLEISSENIRYGFTVCVFSKTSLLNKKVNMRFRLNNNQPSEKEGIVFFQLSSVYNYNGTVHNPIYGTSVTQKYGTFYSNNGSNGQDDLLFISNRQTYNYSFLTPYYYSSNTNIIFMCRASYGFFSERYLGIYFPYVDIDATIKNKLSSLLEGQRIYITYTEE